MMLTQRGARGAPRTPSSSLRSEEEETEKLHSVSSGPSFNGDIASTVGLEGHLSANSKSSGGTWSFFRRRSKVEIGVAPLAGNRPLIKSSLSVEKKPCFVSIVSYCYLEFVLAGVETVTRNK